MMMWFLILIVLFVVYLLWTRRGGQGIQQVTSSELGRRLKENPSGLEIIDVREPFEFSGGHIAKAKNLPLGQLSQNWDKISKEKDVVFVCRSGNRSMMAARKAKRAGLPSVYNLTGGMSQWSGSIKK